MLAMNWPTSGARMITISPPREDGETEHAGLRRQWLWRAGRGPPRLAGMDPSIAPVLRTALRSAMRERDRPAVDAIRSALARIANAEAVPIETVPRAGAIEEAAIGVGVADAPRRVLDEAEMRTLVAAEADELAQAAAHWRTTGESTGRADAIDKAEYAERGAAVLRQLAGRG